jgi:signal transduction histidine kinase
LFAKKGEAAFQEFSRPGSRWWQGQRYIFLYDMSGVCVFHPAEPELVGKNLLGFTDILGRPVIKWIVGIAGDRDKPYGWVHYLWPPPQSLFPRWKCTYVVGVRSPRGKLYVLGSGLYNMLLEKRFIVNLVNRAAALIKKEGEKSFPALRDKANRLSFHETYVYVFTPNGELKVDPAFPPGDKRNALGYKDAVGHYFVRAVIQRLKVRNTAWVMYMWPKPGERQPSKKLMFARRVQVDGGRTYIVGSDLFLASPIWLHF